jgi:hypothetical protein
MEARNRGMWGKTMPVDSRSEKEITLVSKTTGKQATITSRTTQGVYYIDTTSGKKYYTTFNQQGMLSDTSNEVPKGGAWIKVPTPVRLGGLQPVIPPSTPSGQVVMPHGGSQLASSKIALIQSLLRICEGNKEFSMAKSGDSDLILEEKVAAPKFLGLTLGSPKKGYSARISLDEGKKEVKYQEVEDKTKGFGKAQDNPVADRMRGSIRKVVESAGWRLSYTS